MKIHFHLYYSTRFGENLYLKTELRRGQTVTPAEYPMQYLNDAIWHVPVELENTAGAVLSYFYEERQANGAQKAEGSYRQIELTGAGGMEVYDYWAAPGAVGNAFETQAFGVLAPAPAGTGLAKKAGAYTHLFKVKAPLLPPDEVLCLLGHGTALRAWDTQAPLLLQPDAYGWAVRVDLSGDDFPLSYKYGVWNTRTRSFSGFEEGGNRALYPPAGAAKVVLHDGFARFPAANWRGAGVAIPVFSLRTAGSFGVGEFTDLPALADWAQSAGLRLIQLLPINDTSATGSWTDSYPYAAISAFALHPVYLNVAEVAGKSEAALLRPYAKQQARLNALEAVDYVAVMQTKWEIIRQLYAAQKTAFLTDPDFIRYFTENQQWLLPYAAFCYLRDKNGTPDFSQWPEHAVYQEKEIEKLVSPRASHYDHVAIHYYAQWHLHRQLRAAVEYVHAKGLVLKGDIPIGIYRHSCDAWVEPELYHMDIQAGAPPDDFAVNGQNWGFPTYNWQRMKADGFAWWRQRFRQMSLYFDAFRIDHILGFFRIWSIPMDAVEGILGYFVPALPLTEREFQEVGIGFNHDRLCAPFINDPLLEEQLGADAGFVREHFLERTPDGGHWSGAGQYRFKPAFDTQRKVEAYFAAQTAVPEETAPAGKIKRAQKNNLDQASRILAGPDAGRIKQALFSLLANVILIEVTPPLASEKQYAFRIGIDQTSSFQYLPAEIREPLQNLYVNYFFRRQDQLWQREAMEKLPDLKRATNMLICGEDLGMVPHCVPDVMQELGILSLEIQRMPKKSGAAFFHPKDAPYLAVVTPSTHDMSTLRGWWEEDRRLIQRFFNEILGYAGTAPYFCEPWVCRLLLAQHLHSPAMWSIFQLQDLLGMDGALRRQDTHAERINIPANPRHYWRYRLHLTLEQLQKAGTFNDALRDMVRESGR
ncbi:MAG: 4-alpha-glucanotransferase [Saprospirales bacterium]|nr:4-alpha-glucanotransferase [Saprospirales bacterium]MBK8923209.1 4-alpha-glucanotransferase [Saprospirales bacterium]